MKKALSIIAAFMLFGAFTPQAWAYDFWATAPSGQTLYYSIRTDGTSVSVVWPNSSATAASETWTGYTKPTGGLIIPNSVTNGGVTYTVKGIGTAFYQCTELTSVVVADSVLWIAVNAFSGCTGLTSVTIGNSVSSIGDRVFYNCSNLTSVTIPNSVTTIGDYAFYGCSGLTSVTIPNSVTTIGDDAFANCSNLTSVAIGNSVTTIGDYAFAWCLNITSVNIPSTVTSIGAEAFYQCEGLTSITIPNNVTSIGSQAFGDCTGLTSVTFNADSCISVSYQPFYGDTNITSFIFGNNVKCIPSHLCEKLVSLTSITIPNSVIYIDTGAFQLCMGLTSITIPNSVTSIGNSAFLQCTSLSSVTIPNSITSIKNYTFYCCTSLTSVTIPNSVISIGREAFAGCPSLTSVTIPNSVTSIGREAFAYCYSLTSVTIPNAVTSIGINAFLNCTGLTSVVFNADSCVSAVSNYDFRFFAGCSSITSFTFGNNVKRIPNYLCSGLSNITSIAIPNTVTQIGSSAFYNCNHLTSVTIPNAVTSIGHYAFDYCTSLVETHYMGTMEQWFGINLGNDEANPITKSHNLYLGDSLITQLIIPDGFTEINANFQEDTMLTYIEIPSSVTSIAANAFHNCNPSYFRFFPATPPSLENKNALTHGNSIGSRMIVPWQSLSAYKTATNYTSFAQNYIFPDSCQLSVSLNDASLGTATMDGENTLTKLYTIYDTATVIVSPVAHYHSTIQTEGCSLISTEGESDITYRVALDMNNAFPTLQVNFVIDTYSVSVVSSDITRGMVESTGTEFVYGTPCTVTATAYTGYTFHSWSNGVTANPYTFAVQDDVELTALFVAEGEAIYTVTVVSADSTMGTASGGGQALDGGTVTIRAAGNPGYHFLHWNDNNTDSVRTVEVHGNVTYTAYFASNSTETIDDVNGSNIKVYAIDGSIVVEGRENRPVWVFDMYGRVVDNRRLPSGVYLVKVGTLPARKVVVIR